MVYLVLNKRQLLAIQNQLSIHQIRNTFKYVSYKDSIEIINDFKSVYKAVNEVEGLSTIDFLEEKWGKKYPTAIRIR